MKPKKHHLHLWAFRPDGSRVRGRKVASFALYKELVAEARKRAAAAGCRRWGDRFDYAQD